MKKLMMVVCALGFLGMDSAARAEDSVNGHWGYFMKIFKGQEDPETPEDTLRLRYFLEADGSSRLFWWHEGENRHCERRGHYKIEDNLLVDTTEWVDPENSQECSQDPDMQADKTTKTPFSFKDGNLVTRLQLGEDELFYVWKRVEE